MLRLFPAALLALALPASAQVGVAIVQAPEQSWGIAIGETAADAFKVAIDMCVEGGALAQDCVPTNWCMPSGWTVTVGVMHLEGLHWSESVCGLPERPIAEAVGAALCDLEARPWVSDCVLAQIYDPLGTPTMTDE